MPQSPAKSASDIPTLDALTGGAFTAPTSGERAARVRDWLATEPSAEQMQEVFKELSVKDKGAAKPLREKLDELKRLRNQESIAAEWAARAQALLSAPRLNIADAMAWQRDAAKAGAPLSREPLAGLRNQLSERVKAIEDLQTRAQIHREAAVLLAQRIEILSTKPWRDAQAVQEALAADVSQWQQQADALAAESQWDNVDAKFPTQLDASRQQLVVVWEAFASALTQTAAASADATAELPPVPVWADEIRAERGEPVAALAAAAQAAPQPAKGGKPERLVDPGARVVADRVVQDAAAKVQQAVAEGQGKAAPKVAGELRQALKEFGHQISKAAEAAAHAALSAAGELEGWQRWRGDQLREELVARAENLFERPAAPAAVAAAPADAAATAETAEQPGAAEGAEAAPAAPAVEAPQVERQALVPRLTGRKMQDALRKLREEWKQVDQGGPANHALWKRFDEACNEAHKVVEAWLEKAKAETDALKSQRLALIEEVKAWTAAQAQSAADWKTVNRQLHGFSDRWRQAGHLSEKLYEQLHGQWKEAISAAHAPLEAAQKASIDARRALIAEATELGQATQLRIDAVKALQQRWQAEAQRVPLDRRQEQRLWDAFRKPIDEAFSRKSADREKGAAVTTEVDRRVIEAARAVEAASASGDAQRIREALAELEAAARGQAEAAAAKTADSAATQPQAESADGEPAAADASTDAAGDEAAKPATVARKPVVAVRGDDRPGTRKAEPAAARPGDRGGKFGGRDDRRPGRDARDGSRDGRRDDRRDDRGSRFGDDRAPRGPRLSSVAFQASRDAVEHAQQALRKLAAQAHGEVVTQVLSAWSSRDGEQLPTAQQLGSRVNASTRNQWQQAVGQGNAPAADAGEALLRLEMAAEVPTPAAELDARRALQLKLLTRNDPAPAETWSQDVGRVLGAPHDEATARRLQAVLKALLRK
ncbi:MAG: hypothetical protein GAK30_03300 [Paracidovorax wautersii]|uniref:DUF349 domain-containing protein n=1 Tax=Paracidovorax wautersii TaxID=1177982 RepID=A0A7V8JP00_9BURK|nr:MAG: hypothetical protein GAK30_03300 [Paracidovorax wautersii]